MSTSTRDTTRKVLGSLAVIGTAAAVAGLGTFGTFTDSTTPVNSTLATGTLSITATQQGTLPLHVSGLVPGDSVTRAVNLVDDGNLAFGSLTLTGAASLAPQGTDYLAYTISLPTTAGNTFQGQTAALSLVFSGSQLTGTAR